LGSVTVGVLLGAVALNLVRLNQRFLLGRPVAAPITEQIRAMIAAHPSIESVHSIRSEWVGHP
jgi:zinc transporter 9